MEEKVQRLFPHGVMNGTVWHCDGIRLGHAITRSEKLMSFEGSSPGNVVRLHFGMKGNYSFLYRQLNRSYHLIGGHHNIMYSEGFDIMVENRTPEVETFGIQFPRELFLQYTHGANDLLKQFSEDVMNGKNVMLSEDWGAINSDIQQVIQQVIHCTYAGDLKRLFLLSKSIELLVLCAASYREAADRRETVIKTAGDKERIIAVRDLINDRIHCPPSLSEIARMVGLNEYKLKKGFKETFKNTVFGYLAEQRLHLAHRYLQDTEKTAAEIAAELGYSTPQHFNNAFKKKFGITPHSVRNNP